MAEEVEEEVEEEEEEEEEDYNFGEEQNHLRVPDQAPAIVEDVDEDMGEDDHLGGHDADFTGIDVALLPQD